MGGKKKATNNATNKGKAKPSTNNKGKGNSAAPGKGAAKEPVSSKQQERNTRKECRQQRSKNRYQTSEQYIADFAVLSRQLAAVNMTITDVKGDGNCMFRVLSHQLQGTQDNYYIIRQEICDYVEANRESFEFFVEDDVPWDMYCKTMRQNKEWGGHIQLQAASLVYQVNISIYQANNACWNIDNFGASEKKRRIHISYHDNSHYASVHPLETSKPTQVSSSSTDSTQKSKPAANKQSVTGNTKSSQIESASPYPNDDEQMIMDSTGFSDLQFVREALASHDNNIDRTLEDLFTLRDAMYESQQNDDFAFADSDFPLQDASSFVEALSLKQQDSLSIENPPDKDSNDNKLSDDKSSINSSSNASETKKPARPVKIKKADKKRQKKMEKAQRLKEEASGVVSTACQESDTDRSHPRALECPDVPQLQSLQI